jgi:SnoaL-like domain
MKIIVLPAILLGLSLYSCNDKVANDCTMIKQVSVSKGLSLFEAFNAHNWAAMALMYEENARFMDPSIGAGEVTQSRIEIEEKYKALESMFPDIQDSLCYMSPCDSNKIVVEFVSMGTALDGSSFRLPITSILTFKNGLIVSDHTYYDNSQTE